MTETSRKFGTTGSRAAEKFVVRLQDGMRQAIAEVAKSRDMTMNSFIVSELKIVLNGSRPWTPAIGQLVLHEGVAYGLVDFKFTDGKILGVIRQDSSLDDDRTVPLADLKPLVLYL